MTSDPAVESAPSDRLERRGVDVQAYAYIATAFWGISLGLFSATLAFRFIQLRIPIFDYGITLSVYAAGMLATESLWGAVAFRLGRPLTIIGIGSVVGIATLILAFATTLPVFLVAEVMLGALGVYLAPLLRWVALKAAGAGSEGSGAGRWSSVFGLGIALGVSVGPLEFVNLGFRDVGLTSIAMLAVAVGSAAALPWSRAALPPANRSSPSAWRSVTTRPFLLALGLVLIAFAAMTFTTNFLQYYSVDLFGGTPSEAGYVMGAARTVTLIAAFVLGDLVDRWGTARTIPAGFVLLLAGGLATWAARSYDEMILATLVFSAGIGWLFASLLPLALTTVPAGDQGAAIGVFGSVEDTGLLIGPLLFSAAWAAYGATSIFPVITGLAAMGVVGSVLVTARGPRSVAPVGFTVRAARDSE